MEFSNLLTRPDPSREKFTITRPDPWRPAASLPIGYLTFPKRVLGIAPNKQNSVIGSLNCYINVVLIMMYSYGQKQPLIDQIGAPIEAPLGQLWRTYGEQLGHPCITLGATLEDLWGTTWAPLGYLWGTFGAPLGQLWGLGHIEQIFFKITEED